MCDLGMIERALLQSGERGGGGSRDKAVKQHGDIVTPSGERRAKDGGKLVAAKDPARDERVGMMGPMALEPSVDRFALSRQTGIVKSGAAPGPTLAAAAEQRRGERRRSGGVADAHLAEANSI